MVFCYIIIRKQTIYDANSINIDGFVLICIKEIEIFLSYIAWKESALSIQYCLKNSVY